MKKLLWICALALSLLAVPSRAQAWWYCPSTKVDIGVKCWFNVTKVDLCDTAPWYTYFPCDPNLHAAGQPYYPFWPQTPRGPAQAAQGNVGMPNVPTSYTAGAPPYWYGR
jgi:hypothetical protein